MRLIKPSYEILTQEPGLLGIYKTIEQAGELAVPLKKEFIEKNLMFLEC